MQIKVEIIRKKIKHINMRFYPPDTLRVSAPLNAKEKRINEFINSKKDWIKEQYLKNKEKDVGNKIKTVLYLGKKYPLVLTDKIKGCIFLNNKFLMCSSLALEEQKQLLFEKLSSLFFDLINNELIKDASEKAKEFNLNMPKNIKIKLMNSRYGSYSKRTDTINLNAFLVNYEKDLIMSVILHELCHTKYMDHQKGFYNLLMQLDPFYKKHRNMLKKDMSEKNCYILKKD